MAKISQYPASTPMSGDLFVVARSGNNFNIPFDTLYVTPPDGQMVNGKLSVTVASNNLTVALKTLAGTDPSATNPVYVRIGDTIRTITTALSVTKNAGTNWCNAGSAELATKEIDYFAYLIWNTTPATDIIDIGFSRIPYGRVYSDFSGTSTNEKYLAQGNASAPTSTDNCVVIGRFAATLSAGAGYTWTVPTYTSANLIQHPVYESRWLDWVPTVTSTGGAPTTVGKSCAYRVRAYEVSGYAGLTITDKGTATGNLIATLPFSATGIGGGGGREDGSTGKALSALISGATVAISLADGLTVWVNGYVVDAFLGYRLV